MHREEELGGPLGHLTELGVPQNLLNFSGAYTDRASNVILKSATKLQAATGHECYQHCLADSRCAASAKSGSFSYIHGVNRSPGPLNGSCTIILQHSLHAPVSESNAGDPDAHIHCHDDTESLPLPFADQSAKKNFICL